MALTDARPDAEQIQKLASRWHTDWGNQRDLDKLQLAFIMMKNPLSLAQMPGRPPSEVKALRSGIGGLVWREDAALLTVTPGLHINVPEEDEEQRQHASGVLEPWLAGAAKLSQSAGQVWNRKPGDMRAIGRAWSCIYPHPRLWADSKEYRQLVKELQAAAAEGGDEYDRLKKDIKRFKQDRFPIRWRYVDPRCTWSIFQGEDRLPQVIEMGKMTVDEIENEFGTHAIPGDRRNARGTTELDVVTWGNWAYTATLIGSKEDPKIAKEFEHGLEMSGYILMEAELLPENDYGWRWGGALFHATDMIETFDEILSDLRHNHHENTLAYTLQVYDKEAYEEDAKVGGRPKEITLEPGGTYAIWNTEDIRLGPVPQINPQSIFLLQEVKQLIQQSMIRPVERGEAKAGTSNNLFTTTVQIAEREFDPSMEAIRGAYENAGKLFFRCVNAINRHFEADEDKVYVFVNYMGKLGVVGINSKDIRGWENAIQARASRAIPIDRFAQVTVAQALLSMGVGRQDVFEQELGYEDPQRIVDRGRLEALDQALFEDEVAFVRKLAGQALSELTPEEVQELLELYERAPDQLKMILSQAGALPGGQAGALPMNGGTPNTTAMPESLAQTMANVGRTGVPQMPQQPQGPVVGGPSI